MADKGAVGCSVCTSHGIHRHTRHCENPRHQESYSFLPWSLYPFFRSCKGEHPPPLSLLTPLHQPLCKNYPVNGFYTLPLIPGQLHHPFLWGIVASAQGPQLPMTLSHSPLLQHSFLSAQLWHYSLPSTGLPLWLEERWPVLAKAQMLVAAEGKV